MTQENVSDAMTSAFDDFDFHKAINKSIKKEGFETPTPIQSMAIPHVMAGVDIMGIAQTGSGKTAAFSLPMINGLIPDYEKPKPHHPKVLILAPTRELVMQIGKFIDQFSRGTPIRSLVVAGGQSYQPQIRKLKYGIDILISTPGRLIDHMKSGNVKLDECGAFILDEADRMLDMGFVEDVREIRRSFPEDHQTIMFSATMNDKVRNLSKDLLRDPEFIEQERKTVVADTISHKLMNVRRKHKTSLLITLLKTEQIEKAIVFARTKRGADKICDELKEVFEDTPLRIDAIHGDKKQRVREKILMNFRKGRTKVLVATDVAARGIDVDGITHVINYELPIDAENYVHRVGRTGRAGEYGIAISFCDPSDMRLLKEIEELLKIKIEIDKFHRYHFEQSEEVFEGRKRRGRNKPGRRRSEKPREQKGKDRRPLRKRAEDGPKERKRKDTPRVEAKKAPVKKYDPLDTNFGFDDDPVLEKLRGKTTKRKTKVKKREEKPDAKKTEKTKRNKPEKGKSNRSKPSNSRPNRRGKTKQTGGHKTFSPKRKR